jgi:hypothetical protein
MEIAIKSEKKRHWHKPLFLMFIIFMLCTCIDPYYPVLHQTKSLLVVDALLTNDNSNCYVKLSRSSMTQDSDPEKVTGALINIRDENGGNPFCILNKNFPIPNKI